MRANEIAVLIPLQAETAPIHNQFGALIYAALHQVFDICFGCCGNNRAIIHLIAAGVGADLQLFYAGDQFFDQLVGGFFAHRNGH